MSRTPKKQAVQKSGMSKAGTLRFEQSRKITAGFTRVVFEKGSVPVKPKFFISCLRTTKAVRDHKHGSHSRLAKNPVFKPKNGHVYVAQQDRALAS